MIITGAPDRDAPDHLEHLLHRRRLPDDRLLQVVERRHHRGGQLHRLACLQRILDHRPQFVAQRLLAQKLVRAELHRLDHRVGRRKAGIEHHQRVGIGLTDAPEQFHAGHRLDVEIEQHQIRLLLLKQRKPLLRIRRRQHAHVRNAQVLGHPLEKINVGIDG